MLGSKARAREGELGWSYVGVDVGNLIRGATDDQVSGEPTLPAPVGTLLMAAAGVSSG